MYTGIKQFYHTDSIFLFSIMANTCDSSYYRYKKEEPVSFMYLMFLYCGFCDLKTHIDLYYQATHCFCRQHLCHFHLSRNHHHFIITFSFIADPAVVSRQLVGRVSNSFLASVIIVTVVIYFLNYLSQPTKPLEGNKSRQFEYIS